MSKELLQNNLSVPDDDNEKIDLSVLHEAAKLIGQSDSPEIAIGNLLHLMSQLLGLNRGRVLLPCPSGKKIRINYAYGLTNEEKKKGLYEISEGVTGHVMKTGQIAVVQNIDEEPLYLFRAVERAQLPDEVVAYIAIPILDGEFTIGVLACHRLRLRKRAINDDLVILKIIATFIAQILKINNLIEERTARLTEENKELKDALSQHRVGHGILGESLAIKNALRQIAQVADTTVTVLLTGESGTGKEKFSRMIHLSSSRRDEPFIAINCAAIPKQLIESELFGHEKGAFTGASSVKKGKLELADGGTFFLDEIGDLDLELQSKLLRALESNSIQRLGGLKDIPINVRFISASHKNLQRAVNEGSFRLDLFYRLNVFPINLPPIRERTGDIRVLAIHFLHEANREYNRNVFITKRAIECLEHYNWPGNIRQLENVIKRMVLTCQANEIDTSVLQNILVEESDINKHVEAGRPQYWDKNYSPSYPQENRDENINQRGYNWVREDEAGSLLEALKRSGGNKTRAASSLGMTARQYNYRIQKLGLMDS
jgi:Nif-specific regulatory protein